MYQPVMKLSLYLGCLVVHIGCKVLLAHFLINLYTLKSIPKINIAGIIFLYDQGMNYILIKKYQHPNPYSYHKKEKCSSSSASSLSFMYSILTLRLKIFAIILPLAQATSSQDPFL